MLINLNDWIKFCEIPIKGIIHIGAHKCEEQPIYDKIGIDKSKVIWIDAIIECVDMCKNMGFNIYNLVVSDIDNEPCTFRITNNGESSSMLELDTHLTCYPYIYVTEERQLSTTRMDTFINGNNVDIKKYNYLNLDIQGAELKALKGFGDYLKYVDYIYSEVNVNTLYKDCALLHEMDSYLKQFGFERRLTEITGYEWGDAFYVKKTNINLNYDYNYCSNYYVPANQHFNTCVDIGGNCGNFTLKYNDIFDKIHVYEPVTGCNYICKARLSPYKHITVYNEAVYRDNDSYVNMISHSNRDSASVALLSTAIKINEWDLSSIVTPNVKTVDLETILMRLGNSDIDYMKIDCETSEYNFLYNKDLTKIKRLAIEIHHQLGEELWNKLIGYILTYFDNVHNTNTSYTYGFNKNFYFESKTLSSNTE